MKYQIIYVSGLGDKYDLFRRFSLSLWKVHGVSAELVAMKWNNVESFEEKKQRVDRAVKKALLQKRRVILIGESAGASMVINAAYHHPDIFKMVSLCGVNTSKTPISPRILARRPAFAESVEKLDTSRDKLLQSKIVDIINITARSDVSVPVKRNLIPGATHHIMPSHGHLTTIALCLTLYSRRVVRLVTRET